MTSQNMKRARASANWPKLLAIVAGGLSAALGMTVMVGWHTHNTTLLQIHPSFVAMVYNTALGFFLCGLALLMVAIGRPRLGMIGGAYAVLLGLLTLSEFLFEIDLGIDQLLMRHYVLVANTYPGRMALNTAVFFTLVGAAILLLTRSRRFQQRPMIVGIVGSITLAQGVVAFSGYLTGITTAYAWGTLTRMAVHTATGLALFGIGLIALAWYDHQAGRETGAPRWLPILVGVGVATATLCLWQALVVEQRAQIQRTVAARTVFVRNEILVQMQSRVHALVRVAKRWENQGRPNQQAWESNASLLIEDYRGFQNICWIDSSYITRWIVPLLGNESSLNANIAFDERRQTALETARNTRQIAISHPVDLLTGEKGSLVLVPIYEGDQFSGYINGSLRIHDLFNAILPEEWTSGYAITVSDGAEEIYRRGEGGSQWEAAWGETAEIALPGMNWQVKVWPEKLTMATLQSLVDEATLVVGLLLSLVLAWVVHLALAARRHSVAVIAASHNLEREITERSRAEQQLQKFADELQRSISELRDSEESFRTMANSISQLAWMADEKGYIFWYNERWFDYSGTTLEEMGGWGWQKVHHPDHVQRVVDKITKCFQSGEDWDDTFPLRGRDGNYRWFLSRAVPIRNPEGKVLRWFGTNTDISESKILEEELAKTRDIAIESVRLKSEFLANMSHEIRTPMNGVIGMTGILLDTELTPEQQEFAETIRSSAESLLTIINDILDFSKIEAGKLHFETLDFDLRAAVESSIELLAERAQAKGLELAALVHSNVPAQLRGDPGRLRQVLTNLASNAVKFTDRGEVIVRATKESETDSHVQIRFAITDTGIGISEEARSRLFRAFVQADGSTTRKYGGTGLGLAISKQLVELMGGEIGVESEPGKGSTFWFTAQLEKQLSVAKAVPPPHADLDGLRVLIVDDNATSRKILSHQIVSWKLIPSEAKDGDEALAMLRAGVEGNKPYDIVLTDLHMSGMDGFELTRTIKADASIAAVPVVLMPSFGQRGDGQVAREIGFAAYLTKPVRQSQLYDCLVTVLERSSVKASQPEVLARPKLVTRHTLKENETMARKLILIAEDNIVNQKIATRQVEKLGYRADVVANGREALEALTRIAYDLLLMDCQMPEMDGYEATAVIRLREGQSKHTPIIAMTANAMEGDRERCLAAGMDDYITKPVKPEELGAVLTRFLANVESVALV